MGSNPLQILRALRISRTTNRVVKVAKVHLLHNCDKFIRLILEANVRNCREFLECHKEYNYLGPGGAKNKVEWVSKTMLNNKTFMLSKVLTPRRKNKYSFLQKRSM